MNLRNIDDVAQKERCKGSARCAAAMVLQNRKWAPSADVYIVMRMRPEYRLH